MSSAYRVDPDELLDAVDRMRRFEQQLTSAMDDADREVKRLHATWSGAAAEEHRAAHAAWLRGAQEMHEALTVMRGIAQGAHHNYTAAASANVSMWRF